jgi:DNA primase
MIKQSIIDELRFKMDITEVVSNFLELKKNQACCPFHNEKSPSFRVTPAKQIFKCFGCGEGGDAIRFVMKHEKKSFLEAIEWLCGFYHIGIEYDQQLQQEYEKTKDAREEQLQLLTWAQKKFEECLHALPDDAAAVQYLLQRGYDRDKMRSWSLGVAPDDWKFLTTPCINMGKHGAGVDCGLLYSEGGKNWDFFRNRITIPIHDHNGVLVGFGGRLVPGGDVDKKQPKYLNPKESLVYSKSKVWYGLQLAAKAIKEEGFVYVCEGYMDVQSMHDSAMMNTVASCGTEIDENQVKLLKRYTDHVVMCYDGDEPGQKKAMKQIDLFLKHHFKVSVVDLPEGKDPDEYINELAGDGIVIKK